MSLQDRTKLLTAEEFWTLYGDKDAFANGLRLHYELINGEVVDVPMPGGRHGAIQNRVGAYLRLFLDNMPIGEAYTEATFELAPDTMRIPDVAFVRQDKLKLIMDPEKYIPFAPDLAVEVISPSNTLGEMREKRALYFVAGTALVWLIDPEAKQVTVHHSDRTARTFIVGETLDGGDVLPGFSIPVASFFPPDTPEGQL